MNCQFCNVTMQTLNTDRFGRVACTQCSKAGLCRYCSGLCGADGVNDQVCPFCEASAVKTEMDLADAVPPVRDFIHSFGIRLVNRVRVTLVTPPPYVPGERRTLGTTHRTIGGSPAVRAIQIERGLPLTLFGATLAHEMIHGWMAGVDGVDPSEEEGLCELISSWWLVHRGGPFAKAMLEDMETDPDPVYGVWFRVVRDRYAHLSQTETISAIAATHQLPVVGSP